MSEFDALTENVAATVVQF